MHDLSPVPIKCNYLYRYMLKIVGQNSRSRVDQSNRKCVGIQYLMRHHMHLPPNYEIIRGHILHFLPISTDWQVCQYTPDELDGHNLQYFDIKTSYLLQ